MNKNLMKKTEQWKSLERATLKQREIAEAYYAEELMGLITKEFIKNNKEKVYEKVDVMIMSVGTSYEPLVLNISLFQPVKVLFLYTEKTEKTIDQVVEFCGLSSSDFHKAQVNEVEPLDIYKEIKKAYLKWASEAPMYIDITGGTKAMSAAAAMAGAVIDIQLVYMGSTKYLTDFRKPDPGSETLYYVSNPYEVFGDLEIEKALQLFQQYNYVGAKEKLKKLLDKIPDPIVRQELELVCFLAQSYEHWDALEFEEAYEQMQRLTMHLQRDMKANPKLVMAEFYHPLKEQEEVLKRLSMMKELLVKKDQMGIVSNLEYMIPLMFTMRTNANIREKQEKYDSATLLYYRLLEMIEQRRLAKYGLNVSSANFLEIAYDYNQTPEYRDLSKENRLLRYKEQMKMLKIEVFGKCNSTYLPEQISLLDGFLHLSVLGDEIMKEGTRRASDQCKRLRSVVYLRNNSIFAHGYAPVSYQDYLKFKNFVEGLFERMCLLENVDYNEWLEKVTFFNPTDSKYCSLGVKKIKE